MKTGVKKRIVFGGAIVILLVSFLWMVWHTVWLGVSLGEVARSWYLFGLFLLLLLLPLWVALERWIFRPLACLEQANRYVMQGNLQATMIPEEHIPEDEIGEIMRMRNAMLAHLIEADYILESMLDVVVVANPDGTVRKMNRAALELLGYTAAEVIGRPVGMVFEEEEEEEEEEEDFFKGSGLRQLVREGAARDVELTLRTKSGERIPVVFNGSVIRGEDGHLSCVVGVARDMRETRTLIAEIQRRVRELEFLNAIAETLNCSQDLSHALDNTLESLLNLLGLPSGWVLLAAGQAGETFHLAAARGLPPALAEDFRRRGDLCDCQRRLLAGALDHAEITVDCQRIREARGDVGGLKVHASVPLRAGDEWLGIINLASAGEEPLPADDSRLLAAVGHQVSVAVERARLFDGVTRRTAALEASNKELAETQDVMFSLLEDLEEYSKTLEERVRQRTFDLEVLYELSQQLGYTLDYDELFRSTLSHLHRAVAYDVGAGLLVTDEQSEIFIRPAGPLAPGIQEEVEARLMREFEQMSGQKVDRERLHVHTVEVETVGPAQPVVEHLDASFQVPLTVEKKTVGLLFVGAGRKGAFTGDHTRLLHMVANQTARAIQRLRVLLAVEQQRLGSLVEHLPEGVCLLDEERRIELANPAAREYLPVLVEAGVGEVISHIGGRAVEEVLAPRADGRAHEVVVEGPPQRIFEVAARRIEERVSGGGWVLVARDVTQEREAQDRLQQQDRLAAVGQLAAGIAHDFNNLLTVMMGTAQIMEMRQDVPDTLREDLKNIYTQGQRAAQLIRQILDFSRKSVVQRQPVELVPFLKEAVKLMERMLPETIRVVTEFGSGNHIVKASLTQLQQVITNLSVNARDAMPAGGELRVGVSSLHLEPGQRPHMEPGKYVVLTVSDTGIGMSPEVVGHIFEPFFTTKRPGQGTGLGLAQVYGIVKQHEGFIDVESEVGRGTTFRIYLPSVAEAEETEAQPEEKTPRGHGETILVVEDEARVLQVVRTLLEYLHYRILTASNGQEALEVYDRHRDEIALVLTDMVMPEMGGIELVEALKERDAGVRVVILTGYSPEGKGGEKLPQGITGWVEKPPTLEKIGRVVREALRREEHVPPPPAAIITPPERDLSGTL